MRSAARSPIELRGLHRVLIELPSPVDRFDAGRRWLNRCARAGAGDATLPWSWIVDLDACGRSWRRVGVIGGPSSCRPLRSHIAGHRDARAPEPHLMAGGALVEGLPGSRMWGDVGTPEVALPGDTP
jgi:hypothetical protein